MPPRALLIDALREIRRYPARFLSILTIVAIGAGLFVGIKGAAPDMKYTADQYYDRQNMMDVRVLSTLGLVAGDIDAIRAVEGVEAVQPGYFVDVTTQVDSLQYVLRIHSLPIGLTSGDGAGSLNKPRLVSGRMPSAPDEAVIEVNRNVTFDKGIGDTVTVASGKTTGISETLKHTTYTIVGTVVSPFYLTFDREPSDIGSGRAHLFLMIAEDEFTYPAYTEALVTVAGARALDSYSDDYTDTVARVTSRLENVGAERASLRLAEIKASAQAELDKGKEELATQQAAYDEAIASGAAQLAAAENDLVAGRARLDTGQEAYRTQIASGRSTIASFEGSLSSAESQYRQMSAAYNTALSQASSASSQGEAALAQIRDARDTSAAQVDSLEGMLDDANLTDEQRATIREQIAREREIQSAADSALGQVDSLTATATAQINSAKRQMDAAGRQLANARAQLDKAKRDLNAAEANARAELAAGEAELARGQVAYDTALAEFQTKKADGAAQLKEGQQKILDAEDQLERLSEPTWYVLDRTKVYSYADYAATADRMDAIAALFPVFFFAVAALVCLTTMTRMVDEQRMSIGTYKALGYSQAAIALKYVTYAAVASLAGGIIGVLIGIRIFPRLIFDSWAMMYELPPMEELPQATLLIATVLVSVLLITATAYVSVRSELTAVPATLMRPKAPKAGKVIWMERIPALWSRLSFSQKVTMRNIFRYKKRFFMTVVGIAGCAALLVAGLGLNDSIGRIVDQQYGSIFRQDLDVRLEATVSEQDRGKILEVLDADPAVAATLPTAQLNAVIKDAEGDISATLVAPLHASRFDEFVQLRTRDGQQPLGLPASGAVITEKLAKELGVGVGDTMSVNNGNGVFKKITVAAITENYIFHYVYMSPAAYAEIYRLEPSLSGVMIKLASDDKAAERDLGASLITRDDVASVTYYSEAATKFAETIKSLNGIVWAMIASAGLLAFVVLYNLTNINLSERVREIATIKVLGFHNREVAAYVYRENFLLTGIGALVGLVVGVALHRAIMTSIEQDNIMFGNYVAPLSFVGAVALTLVFGVIVSAVMYPKLTGIKMVESLKSVE